MGHMAHGTHDTAEMHIQFWSGNVTGSDRLGDPGYYENGS